MKQKKIFLMVLAFQVILISCSKNDGNSDNPVIPPISSTLNIVTNNTTNIIGQNQATIGGNITSDGGTAITARGICWNTSPSPTILSNKIQTGSGIGTFTATLTNLLNSTIYYARAFATTNTSTVYGAEINFTTKPLSIAGGGVTDADGNTYTTVIIADKEWMAENLRTAKYQNGDIIPNITATNSWYNTTTGALCYYNNSSGYNNSYGKLYNWFAATDARKISPVGWHVPSLGEWSTLVSNYGALNSSVIAGGALKQAGTSQWQSPNTNATNVSNFTALPGGIRIDNNGNFSGQGQYGYWWTADEQNPISGRLVSLIYNQGIFNSSFPASAGKTGGLSIRCVKD